jgi:hypothetical protein
MAIKFRCLNTKSNSYKNYGEKGISISDDWLKFENFLFDMGIAPDGMSIDRIGNNKGYCKENCRWATSVDQNRNRRNVRKYEYLGNIVTIQELSEITGIKYGALYKRLVTNGLSVEDAVSKKLWYKN